MLCWGEVKQEGGYLIDLMRKTFIYMKLEIFLSISYLKLSINNCKIKIEIYKVGKNMLLSVLRKY